MLFPSCQVDFHNPIGSKLRQIRQYPLHISVLVTGGAGYIGSHVARIISQLGTEVQVVDNYSTGLDSRVLDLPSTNLELSDEGATAALEQLMSRHKVTAVVHLAALKQVGESVERPEEYFLKTWGFASDNKKCPSAALKTS